MDPGECGQCQQDGRNDDHAAQQRDRKALCRAARGAEECRAYDVKPRAPEAEEVDAQAGHRIVREHGVARTVEGRCNRPGKRKHQCKQHGGDRERGQHAVSQQAAQRGRRARAAAVADQRLRAGGKAGEDRDRNQREVGDNAVSRNACVACKP